MQAIDAFGKPVQDFQVKTACGGYLSLCSIIIMVILFVTELQYFLELDTKDKMTIDQDQDQKYVNISFNVTFTKVPCAALAVNLLDPKQANVMHVGHDIYKTRLSQDSGKQLGLRIRDSLRDVAVTASELMAVAEDRSSMNSLELAGALMSKTPRMPNRTFPQVATHATTHWRCGSCFGSHPDEDDCCFTCESVRQAYKDRGWSDQSRDYVFSQCADEVYAAVQPQLGESCNINARLLVRKVPGTIHVGISRHIASEYLAGSRLVVQHADFSHEVHSLSFGPDFPGFVKVLDGRIKQSHRHPNTEHYKYDIHIIPTRYQEDGGEEISSHQYSVTEHVKAVNASDKTADSPAIGVWTSYDFTPFEVKVTKTRKVFTHFLTECCAILGGIFAFTGMLDNFYYRLNKRLADSFRKGGGVQMAEVLSKD